MDSSDPSAIGSPPGSPDNGHNQHSHKKRCINSTAGSSNAIKKNKRKKKPSTKSVIRTKPTTSTPKPSKPKEDQRKNRSTKQSQQTVASSSLSEETDDNRKYSIKCIVVNGITYYHCSYCSKKYDTLHGLNNHHEETHPPVLCDVCNREFSMPNSLIHHSYTHYEHSFNCDQCNKSFPFKSQLETHQVIHTQTIKH